MITKALIVIASVGEANAVVRTIHAGQSDADLLRIDPTLGWESWSDFLPQDEAITYHVETVGLDDPRLELAHANIEMFTAHVSIATLIPTHLIAEPPAEYTPEPDPVVPAPPAPAK